jgi:hypothetical protein
LVCSATAPPCHRCAEHLHKQWPNLIRELLPRSAITAYRSVRAYDAFFCWLGAGNRTADGPIPYCSQIRVAAVMISSNHSCSCSGETSSFVCIRHFGINVCPGGMNELKGKAEITANIHPGEGRLLPTRLHRCDLHHLSKNKVMTSRAPLRPRNRHFGPARPKMYCSKPPAGLACARLRLILKTRSLAASARWQPCGASCFPCKRNPGTSPPTSVSRQGLIGSKKKWPPSYGGRVKPITDSLPA